MNWIIIHLLLLMLFLWMIVDVLVMGWELMDINVGDCGE